MGSARADCILTSTHIRVNLVLTADEAGPPKRSNGQPARVQMHLAIMRGEPDDVRKTGLWDFSPDADTTPMNGRT